MRRVLLWLAGIVLALLLTVLACAAALNAGYLRAPLLKVLVTLADRPLRVEGALRLNLFSLTPELLAERVFIGNPGWTPAGSAAEIGKIILVFSLPRPGHDFCIERLELEGATLNMLRDSTGHANWQLKNPDHSVPRGLPVIHSLAVLDAHLILKDEFKHRHFDGTVSADSATQPFRVIGKGQLNGRPVDLEVIADPLRTAARNKPYGFTFSERSSGSHLKATGFLLRPFDMHFFDATFEASGADLKDLYYLTGTKLIDTGSYRVSGKLARREFTSTFSDLIVHSGQSDLRGSASITNSNGQPTIIADLNSQSLHVADLGARAAGRQQAAAETQAMLLPSDTLDPSAMRRTTANVKFQAQQVATARVTLSAVAVKMSIDRGVLTLNPLSADVLDGKLNVQLKIDARTEIPGVDLDVRLIDMQLGQYARKADKPPAIEGPLQLRATLSGHGKSVHEVAASAGGTLRVTLPSGTVRDSLAELTGIDLRGLGLLLTKSKKEVAVRCGIAKFRVQSGRFSAEELLLDTEPVLIVGEGAVDLNDEAVDFVLRGHPKSVRLLELRAPIVIHGTLKAPKIGIETRDSKLVLIDRGKTNDADCESLLR
jgi:AsmA family protein